MIKILRIIIMMMVRMRRIRRVSIIGIIPSIIIPVTLIKRMVILGYLATSDWCFGSRAHAGDFL